MRKLLAIALVAVFGLPFVSPFFAMSGASEANLPVCCRRNGKHHCMMNMGERSQLAQHDTQFSAATKKCPYYPGGAVVARSNLYTTPPLSGAIFASLVIHPTGVAQTESKRRISRDRSRLERGPPTPFGL